MVFLDPASGVIAGALGVPVLLLFYFLKLRRRPVRVSSTLLWERAVADLQVNAPFRMLRASLQLLLQLLALLALVGALARPAVEGGIGGSRVILLMDVSASMGVRDGVVGPDRLELAKEEAFEVLEGVPRGASVMLVSFAGEPRTEVGYTKDRGLIRRAIEGLEVVEQPGDLGAALRVVAAFGGAGAAGAEGGSEEAGATLVLISDGGERVRGGAQTGDLSVQFRGVGGGGGAGAGDSVASEGGAGEGNPGGGNVGIVGLVTKRDAERPELVRVFVTLATGGAAARTVGVSVREGGDLLDGAVVEVPGGVMGVDGLEAGRASLTLEFERAEGGILRVGLEPEDGLGSDDVVWVVLSPPRGVRALVVWPDGGWERPAAGGEASLIDGLTSLGASDVLVLTEGEARRTGLLDGRGEDGGFDLVVYDRVSPGVVPRVPSLSFAGAPGIPGLGLSGGGGGGGEGSQRVTFWRRTHPVMSYVGLGELVIGTGRRIVMPVGSVEGGGSGDGEAARGRFRGTELATGSAGPVIGLLERGLDRHIVVAYSLDETRWYRDLSFPIFLANAVSYLTASAEAAANAVGRTSDEAVVELAEGVGSGALVGPEGVRIELSAGIDGRATPGLLPRVGVYEVVGGREGGARAIAANLLSVEETVAEVRDEVMIGGEVVRSGEGGGEGRREVWHWFVLAGAVLGLMEWLVYARGVRG